MKVIIRFVTLQIRQYVFAQNNAYILSENMATGYRIFLTDVNDCTRLVIIFRRRNWRQRQGAQVKRPIHQEGRAHCILASLPSLTSVPAPTAYTQGNALAIEIYCLINS